MNIQIIIKTSDLASDCIHSTYRCYCVPSVPELNMFQVLDLIIISFSVPHLLHKSRCRFCIVRLSLSDSKEGIIIMNSRGFNWQD